MSRGSVVPPEVFTAYAKKHYAARMEIIRNRLKQQMNVGNTTSRPAASGSQDRSPVAVVGRPR